MRDFLDKDKDAFDGNPSCFNCPFAQQWEPAKERFESYMKKVDTRLGEIVSAIQESNRNLVGPATGRRQIPLEVVVVLMLLWGVYSVFIEAKDSHKNLKVSWQNGIEITDSKER